MSCWRRICIWAECWSRKKRRWRRQRSDGGSNSMKRWGERRKTRTRRKTTMKRATAARFVLRCIQTCFRRWLREIRPMYCDRERWLIHSSEEDTAIRSPHIIRLTQIARILLSKRRCDLPNLRNFLINSQTTRRVRFPHSRSRRFLQPPRTEWIIHSALTPRLCRSTQCSGI